MTSRRKYYFFNNQSFPFLHGGAMDVKKELEQFLRKIMEEKRVDMEGAKRIVRSGLDSIKDQPFPEGLTVGKNDAEAKRLTAADGKVYYVVQRRTTDKDVRTSVVSLREAEMALRKIYNESMEFELSWGPSEAHYFDEDLDYEEHTEDQMRQMDQYNDDVRKGKIEFYGEDNWGFQADNSRAEYIKNEIMNFLKPQDTHSAPFQGDWHIGDGEGDWEDVVNNLKREENWFVPFELINTTRSDSSDFEDIEMWELLQELKMITVYQTTIKRNGTKRKR